MLCYTKYIKRNSLQSILKQEEHRPYILYINIVCVCVWKIEKINDID